MFVVLSFAAAALQSAMAADIVVGDEKGWLPYFNYTSWAQGKQFKVGDNLDKLCKMIDKDFFVRMVEKRGLKK